MASGESPAYPQLLSCSATEQRFPRLPPQVQAFARTAHRAQESCVLARWLLFSHSVMSNPSATPWTVAPRAPLSMAFPRQKYWTGLSVSSPGNLPDPGIAPMSSALAGRFFMLSYKGSPLPGHQFILSRYNSATVADGGGDGRGDGRDPGEGSVHAFSGQATRPEPPRAYQPRSNLNPVLERRL